MKKEILDRPLNSLVEGILDSYEKYPPGLWGPSC